MGRAAQATLEAEAGDLRESLRELRVQLAVTLCPPDEYGHASVGEAGHPAWVNGVAQRAIDAMRRLEDSERRAERAQAALLEMQKVETSRSGWSRDLALG